MAKRPYIDGHSHQVEGTFWLLVLAAAVMGVALVLHALARFDGLRSSLGAEFGAVFDEPLWALVGLVVLALVLVATSLSALEYRRPTTKVAEPTTYSALTSDGVADALAEVARRLDECSPDDEHGSGQAVDELLRGALRVSASDLHLTPAARGVVATYRVHGRLVEVFTFPAAAGPRLATRIKVLARMNTFERRPQDGRLRHRVGEQALEARVSTLFADHGERVVLRIVQGGLVVPALADLGFPTQLTSELEALLARPQGLLLVSGPVGSGKTTTLYSALQQIWRERGQTTSLVTLEDPIELQLPFCTQTQVNAKMGMSFAQTLRSILRQDPNVLMIGEIRDRESAEISAQAGLTGHLLLSTLHVDRAATVYSRMIEMDVEPFVLSSVVAGSLSQRLVRSLCTHCRRHAPPAIELVDRLARLGHELPPGDYFEAAGCEHCDQQGFAGRLPIGELLVSSSAIREAVVERRTTEQIDQLARREGMVPLAVAGLERARRGETPLSEVLRVVA